MKLLLSLIFALAFNTNIMAAQPSNTLPDTVPTDYSKINKVLDNLTVQLNSGKITSKSTGDILQNINQIQASVLQSRSNDAAELENQQKKLSALGPAPAEGSKEPAEIARQRKEFQSVADSYKARIAQADLIKTKIDTLNATILKIRNQELLNNILTKQSSIFHPQEFVSSLVAFAEFIYEIARSPASWYEALSPQDKTLVGNNILFVAAAMLVALIAGIYLNLYIKKWFGYQKSIERPNYTQKLKAAVWMLIARGIIPAAIIGAFLIWQKNTKIINTGSFALLLKNIAVYLLYYYLLKAAVKVSFIPSAGKWRIIEVSDDKARRTSNTLIFSIGAVCVVSLFQSLASEMDYNAGIVYSLKIFASAVKAFCVVLVANRLLYDNTTLTEDELSDDADIKQLTTSSKISLFITFLMTAAFAVSLFGYIRLSEFIINRFIVSTVVILFFYILDRLIRVLFHQILLFKFWIRTFRINRRSLVKIEFWFGLLLKPLLGAVAILTLLAVWGVSVDILLNNVKSFLIGFNIGGIHISITSILLGIITLLISLFLFRMLKSSFVSGSLSKIEMDEGVKNSLLSLLGFVGLIFSVILAIAVMGGSFASLAIIAGALSFGAGLGLQNMVSNLVAGLTILFERPIKIGDWVVINNQEGIVKKINMRATELETWSKANVIIPNADILSKSLINLTYSNRLGRVEIKVGVGYDSDIELVKKTLVEIAQSNKNVLQTPAPAVAFNDLGDSSLSFQLNCFTANVFNRGGIADDLREKIINRFKELGIDIPFPQRVVYLHSETGEDPK